MIGWGVGLALCAALTHTAIDSTRKYASSVLGISAEGLVAVPALLDAVLACTGVALSGHLQRGWSTLKHPGIFVSATIASSLLLLVSRYMWVFFGGAGGCWGGGGAWCAFEAPTDPPGALGLRPKADCESSKYRCLLQCSGRSRLGLPCRWWLGISQQCSREATSGPRCPRCL